MTTRCDPDRYHRRSIRLSGYDYTQPGAYFVTICTHRQEPLFGAVVDGEMVLNKYGQIVDEEWCNTAKLRPYVKLDVHVVMPNHFHGILWIEHDDTGGRGTAHGRGMARHAPTREFGKPVAGSLPTIVRAFKSAVTKQVNQIRRTPGIPVWQRNYWEHVVRTERALDAIRRYIADNPARWSLDRYNPAAADRDPRVADLWRLLREDAAAAGAQRAAPLRLPRKEE
jgi:putative transposase